MHPLAGRQPPCVLFWYNARRASEEAGAVLVQGRIAGPGRLILFVLLVLAITALVWVSAVTLLPPPPGSPTPTLPFFLGQPEALPRLAY